MPKNIRGARVGGWVGGWVAPAVGGQCCVHWVPTAGHVFFYVFSSPPTNGRWADKRMIFRFETVLCARPGCLPSGGGRVCFFLVKRESTRLLFSSFPKDRPARPKCLDTQRTTGGCPLALCCPRQTWWRAPTNLDGMWSPSAPARPWAPRRPQAAVVGGGADIPLSPTQRAHAPTLRETDLHT